MDGYYVEPWMYIDPERGLFVGLRGQGYMLSQYLAKAYVDMGDAEGARGMLEEVMQEGTDDQKRQAKELLSQIA